MKTSEDMPELGEDGANKRDELAKKSGRKSAKSDLRSSEVSF